jgi:hypothetical protein
VVLLSAVGGFLIALLFGLPEIISARCRIRGLECRFMEGPPQSSTSGAAPGGEGERR